MRIPKNHIQVQKDKENLAAACLRPPWNVKLNTAFHHLRNIAKIRNCLSQDNAETLVHAFMSSKSDFCNALLYGLPQSVIDTLQYVQNWAARLVTRTRKLRTYNTSSS